MSDTFCDKNGYPIKEGDLVRSYHYTGARRKRYYLYHYITKRDGILWMMNIDSVFNKHVGGCCPLKALNYKPEILHGYGEDGTYFDERKKINQEPEQS